jgi:hypothetical protein
MVRNIFQLLGDPAEADDPTPVETVAAVDGSDG